MEAAVMPLPSEETTPPVTNTNLAIVEDLPVPWFFRCYQLLIGRDTLLTTGSLHSASGPAGPRRPPPAQPAPRGSRITTRVSSAVPIAPVRLSLGWVGRASSVSPISLANLSTRS